MEIVISKYKKPDKKFDSRIDGKKTASFGSRGHAEIRTGVFYSRIVQIREVCIVEVEYYFFLTCRVPLISRLQNKSSLRPGGGLPVPPKNQERLFLARPWFSALNDPKKYNSWFASFCFIIK